jgi:Ni/Co efflux regulator RcnB
MAVRLLSRLTSGRASGGTAATFDEARARFEAAWVVFLSNRTEADFDAWRDQEAWTREKYRRFDRGERMPQNWRPSP